MQQLRPFHHYSTAHPGPRTSVEQLEERVVELLLETDVADERRESSICFELKHSSAVTQFARLLARQRDLPPELCAVGGLLHDIYVIVDGSYTDHAHKGAPIARQMVEAVGGFDEVEIEAIESIVYNHSDKHLASDDQFAEFGKDIDVLDAFLYPGAFEWYLANKSLPIFQHYLSRARRVWAELKVPADPGFTLLDDYGPTWLDASVRVEPSSKSRAYSELDTAIPPFLLLREQEGWRAHFCSATWQRATESANLQVSSWVTAAAVEITAELEARRDTCAVMVWPAIARIEVLDIASLDKRLPELLGERAAEVEVSAP